MSSNTVKGLADLKRAMAELPAKIEANMMRGAMRAGGKVIAEAAKASVNSVSGELAQSIAVGTRLKGGQAVCTVTAGKPTKSGGKTKRLGWYAHIVEGGAKAHVIKARRGKLLAIGVKKVNHPGAKARPFMRPALDTQGLAAVEAVREYLRKRLATKHGIDVPAPLEEGDE